MTIEKDHLKEAEARRTRKERRGGVYSVRGKR
jgi:hypothetical protein